MYAAYLYLLRAALRDDPELRRRDALEDYPRLLPETARPAESPGSGAGATETGAFRNPLPSHC